MLNVGLVGLVLLVVLVLLVGLVILVGRVNDGIGGKVGLIRLGEIEILDFILGELNLFFLDICILFFLRIVDYI